jgi:hypothetical protein
MQLANLKAASRWLSDIFGGPPPPGNSLAHARWAAWKTGDRGLIPDAGVMLI